ncbi:PQQ-binding-like beta-propeller repeat protein [Kitasatospora sp. NPDC002227]|uniref:protein kinase domain-containing protein n=1 Tax=Kitasatospora sp. NPDC002227 TaxID=3154773 RepID=UPI00332C9A66
MPVQPLEPTDPEHVGPYRLLGRLGAGGMGRVYLARSAGGRTVAVKVVRAELAEDQEFRDRFRREVAAAQAVSGAYTAPVVDADRDGATPWLATAYVLGPSLTDAVAAHGPLPAESVRALGTGLAEALTAIHAAGIVHRDLKPSNVLLASDGPRVIDFGIARALEGARLTSTGLVVGSPGFMSPEQVSGAAPVGPPGDVFALGAVLVYAATGQGPFSAESDSAAALLYRVLHDAPRLDGLPESLRPAVTACLAKVPADRPTPGELAALLGAGQQLARAAWLPAELSAEIATHAAQVMDMETPARGSAAPDPRLGATAHPPTATGSPAAGTMKLGAAAAPAAAPVEAPARPGPSRRGLLIGGGALGLAAAGAAYAWAVSGKPKGAGPSPVPPTAKPTGTGSPRPRTPGVAPQPIWSQTLSSSRGLGSAMPVCVGDLVLLGGDGLTALQLSDGTVRYSKPDAVAGYLGAASGLAAYSGIAALVGADVASGSVLWKFEPNTPANSKEQIAPDKVLAIDDHNVYATCSFMAVDSYGLTETGATPTPGIMALDRKNGKLVWSQRRKAKADNYVNSLLSAGTLLYTDSQKNLVARSTRDGAQLWYADTDNRGAYYQPVADGQRVYCSAAGSGIQAVDIANGRQSWIKTAPAGSKYWYSPPAVADGVVYSYLGGQSFTLPSMTYAPATNPVLYAWNAANGTELWHLELPDEASMAVSPVMVGTTLFVATPNKGVHAVDTKARKVIWTFDTGLTDTVDWQLATDGKVLIAAQGAHAYALPAV